MVTRQLPLFKVKKSKFRISSFCGLPLLDHIAHWLGVPQSAEHLTGLKERQRGYSISQLLMSLVLLLTAGGEHLDDIRMLKKDPAIKAFTDLKDIPDATTLGRFLHRFKKRELMFLGGISTGLATRIQSHVSPDKATLDVDSSVVMAEKEEAKMSYTGERGYNPLLAFLHETKTVLMAEFRPGSAQPGANALRFLKKCLKALPRTIREVFLRSDSAWYQAEVLDHCQKNGVKFTITADRDKAVMQLIASVPEKAWSPFEDQEIAETIHTLNDSEYAYRLIILRRLKEQQDLFSPYTYGAIITNREEDMTSIVRWHRKRADCENIIKENKNGFALEHMPCGSFDANAAFTHIVVLAYNLVQAMKYLLLPESWRTLTIKNLRFMLLHLGGIVIRHARQTIMNLPEDYPYFDLYESLAYQVRGPCLV